MDTDLHRGTDATLRLIRQKLIIDARVWLIREGVLIYEDKDELGIYVHWPLSEVGPFTVGPPR